MKDFLNVLWRLPIFILVWIAMVVIKLPTIILGLIMVPVLYFYRKKEFDEVPKIFLPWQNPEDWKGGLNGTDISIPQWWIDREGDGFWAWVHYHAIRNPANGLRNFDFIDLDLKQEEIKYWTPTYYKYYEPWHTSKNGAPKNYGYIAWQDWRAGVKFIHIWNEDRYLEFKFGWRVEPRDAVEGPRDTSHRWKNGAGFASKFVPYRES